MSRRDTIIIAILVNAGLLMVLFATAMRNEETASTMKLPPQATLAQEIPVTSDELLNQYVSAPQEILFTEDLGVTLAPEELVVETKPIKTATSKELTVNVTVKKGDYLEKIAKANNTSVAAIMNENGLSSTQLKVGQVLRVAVQEKAPEKSSPALSPESEYYIVKDGDSPWLIASKNNVRLDTLLKLNGLDEQKARRLRPGDKIRIR